MSHIAYAFIDGGYLRSRAWGNGRPLYNPRLIASRIVQQSEVQKWTANAGSSLNVYLDRVFYYDAKPDDEDVPDLQGYWDAVELLPDTHLGFGVVRGQPRRQKGVDTLIAVDMLVGAYTKQFSVTLLIAGDSDFVPVIHEVRRCGVKVAVAADENHLADDLKRAADLFIPIDPKGDQDLPLKVNDRYWQPPKKG
jgi:uncharacterized LabA/DUF88 family protein